MNQKCPYKKISTDNGEKMLVIETQTGYTTQGCRDCNGVNNYCDVYKEILKGAHEKISGVIL